MIKKTFMATVIILAFLVPLIAGMQDVNVAKANPFPSGAPSPPPITIQLPLNTTYYQNEILLSFTVVGAKSLFPMYWIMDVYYICDFNSSFASHLYSTNYQSIFPPKTEQFSTPIEGLSNGEHTLTVYVIGAMNYYVDSSNQTTSSYTAQSTQTVNFTTETSPSPSPTPSITPSPTQRPTLPPDYTPTPSPSPTQQPTLTLPSQTATTLVPSLNPEPVRLWSFTFLIVVFAVVVLLAAYLRRTKKQK